MTDNLVETRGLYRELSGAGAAPQVILHDINLAVPRGQFLALTGASGSEIWLDGVEMGALDDDDRAAFRNERLGFVFQFHFLLPEFTVLENVMIPMYRRGVDRDEAAERAYDALAMLNLEDYWRRKPGQLSGGQQQRVSIARAVANDPSLILADEPTGNLDSKNAEIVFEVFERLAREQARTIIMVTHDKEFAVRADRHVALRDGRVLGDARRGEEIIPPSQRMRAAAPPPPR